MHSISQPVIITSMIVAAVLGVLTLPSAIAPFRVKISRSSMSPGARAGAIAGVLAACGVLVAGAEGLPTAAAAHHRVTLEPVGITNPRTPPAGAAPPVVPCSPVSHDRQGRRPTASAA